MQHCAKFSCVVVIVCTWGCSGGSSTVQRSPTAPSSADVAQPQHSLSVIAPSLPPASERNGPTDVSFPPRDQPFRFRLALEQKYLADLNRPLSPTFVNVEGDVVWTQEYLRYRVNDCGHADAVQRVFRQIDGAGVQPVCGPGPSGSSVAFPPRNESLDFRNQLETKYRDQLRAAATQTRVNIEGQIVWTQEYLRYRVNACGDLEAQDKVFTQIDGRGVQPTCEGACTFSVVPSSGSFRPADTGSFQVVTNRDTCVWFVDISSSLRDVVIVDSANRRGSGPVSFRIFTNIDPGIPNPTVGSILLFGDEPTAPRVGEFRVTVNR
jgi:hypothetical protein